VTGNPVTGSARRQAQEHRDTAVQAQQTAPTEDKPPPRPRAGTEWIVAGVFLSLIIACPLVLEVHAAFAVQGSPDYQAPSEVVGNLAIWGLLWLVGPAIAIRGIRRRHCFNADRQTTTRHIR
jgi:hypothetical protein